VIAEKKLALRLGDLMRDARAGYQGSEAERKFVDNEKFGEAVRTFFHERLEFYLKDVLGYAYDVVKAVLAADADDAVDASARAEGLTIARKSHQADFDAVCISFKRIKNILKQAEEKKIAIPEGSAEGPGGWLSGSMADAEKDLYMGGAVRLWAQYDVWRRDRRYDWALSQVASLRPLLDRFFDEVMVMVDDQQIRANRLAILKKLYTGFSTIADFSEIATEGKA
jgi:glycyl-tRNA synthetase beta chain